MTYRVYTIRDTRFDVITSCVRKGVTFGEAKAIQLRRDSNPNTTCKCVIVAEDRVDEWMAKVQKRAEARHAVLRAMHEDKNSRLSWCEEQWKNGRKINGDAWAFIMGDLVKK